MTLSRSELRRGCGKRRYRDELAAKVALAKIAARDDAGHEERRPFRCPRCGGWHLTSQQPDPGRVKAGRSRDPDRQRKSLASPDANQDISPGPPRSDLRVNDFSRTGQTRRTETGFPAAVKLLIRTRAGNGDPEQACCEADGIWLGRYGGEIQHRVARGAGGCKDAVINGLANGALLCHACHLRAEAREREMGMHAKGFWIELGIGPEFDPRLVPIMLASPHGSGMTVWLSATAAEYLTERPQVAA